MSFRHARTFLPFLSVALAAATGCAPTTTYVHAADTTLGRVVVYRNGIAYFERTAEVQGDHLTLKVPADRIDDFLKSLTVVDAQTGQPAPIRYPTKGPTSETGLLDMSIGLEAGASHKLKLSYVTEAPSWKPSYRVVLGKNGKVELEAWAIVDNTSGEDWKNVRLGVGSSSALSFRFDLQSVRLVERETLRQNDLFALAPPMGGAMSGTEGLQKKLLADLDDRSLEASSAEPAPPKAPVSTPAATPAGAAPQARPSAVARLRRLASGFGGGAAGPRSAASSPDMAPMPAPELQPVDSIARMASSLRGSSAHVVVEGFAREEDVDKQAASLARASKLRDELLRQGVNPSHVVAVGKGSQAGRNGGARVVEAPSPPPPANAKSEPKDGVATSGEPIGTSNFESGNVTSVDRGMSAMVSIMKRETEGEVVYLYDPESARGDGRFPFRSVRMKNPSDSALETGPVTVFGDGHFIGEGMAEPIPARGSAFVPFALDRQIVVDQSTGETDEIARILTVQRGVFSTEVQHRRKTTFTMQNRLDEPATVYVRHTVPAGYKLATVPAGAGEEKNRGGESSARRDRAAREGRRRHRGGHSGLQDDRRPRSGEHRASARVPDARRGDRAAQAAGRRPPKAQQGDGRRRPAHRDDARADGRVPRAHERAPRADLHAQGRQDRRPSDAEPRGEDAGDQRPALEGDDRGRGARGEAHGRARPLPGRRRRPVSREARGYGEGGGRAVGTTDPSAPRYPARRL